MLHTFTGPVCGVASSFRLCMQGIPPFLCIILLLAKFWGNIKTYHSVRLGGSMPSAVVGNLSA